MKRIYSRWDTKPGLLARSARFMEKLSKFQEELPENLATLNREREGVEGKLREYDDAKVVARHKVHAGVTVHFGVVYKDITDDHETCSITIQDGKILLSRDISA